MRGLRAQSFDIRAVSLTGVINKHYWLWNWLIEAIKAASGRFAENPSAANSQCDAESHEDK